MKFFDRITNYFSSNKGKHKNAQSIIPSRLNLLLWIVGILLLMLAGRLTEPITPLKPIMFNGE